MKFIIKIVLNVNILSQKMNNSEDRITVSKNINDEIGNYNHLMHIATYQYALALAYANGKRILDYGCGSGYGSYMLASVADHVTAVDINENALNYAINHYKSTNLIFKTINEISDEKYDVITSFQVIEHVSDEKEYIIHLKKLLHPNGLLLLSTPDKKNRLFKFIQKPWYVPHFKEYTYKDLYNLLSIYFKEVELLKIGACADFVKNEIQFTQKQRLITLPCSLSIYPNVLRIFLLEKQASLYNAFKKNKPKKSYNIDIQNNYSIKDIIISKEIDLYTDFLAICKNT